MRDINTTGTTYVLVEGLPCTQLLVIACLPLHSRTVALKFQSNCFLQWRRAVWRCGIRMKWLFSPESMQRASHFHHARLCLVLGLKSHRTILTHSTTDNSITTGVPTIPSQH